MLLLSPSSDGEGPVMVGDCLIYPGSVDDIREGEGHLNTSLRVSVSNIFSDFQDMPPPKGNPNFQKLGFAVGSFLMWPKHLLSLMDSATHITIDKRKSLALETLKEASNSKVIPQKKVPKLRFVLENHSKRLLAHILNLPDNAAAQKLIMPKEICCHKSDLKLYIDKTDILDLIKGDWLDVSILQVWIMFLSRLATAQLVNTFAFFCPQQLAYDNVKKNVSTATNYITLVIVMSKTKKFALLPYFQSKHWMLIVISIQEAQAYILDPSPVYNAPHITLELTNGFTNAIPKLNLNIARFLTCKTIQSGGFECGYFVMRFMLDIIRCCPDSTTFLQDFHTKVGKKYTQAQFYGDIIETWSDFYHNHLLDGLRLGS